MTRWHLRGLWTALGLALSLIHEPFGLWPLAFGVFAAVFWMFRQKDDKIRPFAQGWWFGLGYFAGTFNWIVHPFFIEPEVFGWMAPFGLFGMAGGLALFWGAAFGLADMARKFGVPAVSGLLVSLSLFEAARAVVLSGLPWGMVAQGFVDTGFGQTLSLIGPHGLGLLVMGLSALALAPRLSLFLPVALVCFALLELWGHARLQTEIQESDFKLRLLQTNNAQALKWDPEWRHRFFEENLALSQTPGTFDVVIWPENAVTWPLNDIPAQRLEIARAAGGGPVLVGGFHYLGDAYFNTLAALDSRGNVQNYYNKYHLVPFGEFPPGLPLWQAFGLDAVLPPYWTPGVRPEPVSVAGLPTYLPLICYEMIFPRYARSRSQRPDWIVQITNDAWFGGFSGPYQHLSQARMRAIEQGLPVARVANTGVSAVIDPLGRVVAHLPLNERAVLDHALPKASSPTIYSKIGNWGAWFLLVCIAMGAFWSPRHRNSVDRKQKHD